MQEENDIFAQLIRDQLANNPTARVQMPPGIDQEALIEAFEERAAIREYCGGQSREEAERSAEMDLGIR